MNLLYLCNLLFNILLYHGWYLFTPISFIQDIQLSKDIFMPYDHLSPRNRRRSLSWQFHNDYIKQYNSCIALLLLNVFVNNVISQTFSFHYFLPIGSLADFFFLPYAYLSNHAIYSDFILRLYCIHICSSLHKRICYLKNIACIPFTFSLFFHYFYVYPTKCFKILVVPSLL